MNRMRLLGLALALSALAGLAACNSGGTTANGACGACASACGGEIEGNYDNVAMVFFHSDT